MTTTSTTPTTDQSDVRDIPLSRLKKSPKNARRVPHAPEAIEALAASIAVKGMLQMPVVEPETTEDGSPTGNYLVTIGEGRRQAQLLRAKRKEIKKTELIRCRVDVANDAHEISLDENITRSAMHPADQFEAFHRMNTEQGLGAEEIAARFGITAAVVRQRLRLASVCPRLMEAYRNEALSLEALMAFSVTEDHERQEAVFDTLQSWEGPRDIRRRLMEDRVHATDRRAVFVGAEAYEAEGGVIERDLFSDDDGGYFASVAVLERLALAKLEALASQAVGEGWRWADFGLDRQALVGMPRIYPAEREFSEEEQGRYDQLLSEQEEIDREPYSDEGRERFIRLQTEIEALDATRFSFTGENKAFSGAFFTIDRDGALSAEYGFVRPGDVIESEAEDEEVTDETLPEKPPLPQDADDQDDTPALPDRVVANLTAHRTAALRNALAEVPEMAVFALLHALVLRTFSCRPSERSCLEVRTGGAELRGYAPEIDESPALRRITARHEQWAARIAAAESAESFIDGLNATEALALLAHCASLAVNDVQPSGKWQGDRPAARLATKVRLNMAEYWSPTASSFFGQVTKAVILDAVSEAVNPDAARRMAGGKKTEIVEAAERLVAGTGWLPEPLRTPLPEAPDDMAA